MILTDGDRMIKTPTYHVYDRYKAHQDAIGVLTGFDCDDIGFSMKGQDYTVPSLSGSASLKDSWAMKKRLRKMVFHSLKSITPNGAAALARVTRFTIQHFSRLFSCRTT